MHLPNARLQICPLYIFGNKPPQMVPSAGSKYWCFTRVWRLDETGQIYNPEMLPIKFQRDQGRGKRWELAQSLLRRREEVGLNAGPSRKNVYMITVKRNTYIYIFIYLNIAYKYSEYIIIWMLDDACLWKWFK